jgi:hypothetical protein
VHQTLKFVAAIYDTDDMLFDGIDPRVVCMVSVFDSLVLGSAPTHCDDLGALGHQVKAISAASRAPRCFTDILHWSGDATMRTKDPDVFDRVQRARFDYRSQAVTTDNSGLLWAYPLVRAIKHHLRILATCSMATGFVMVGCWHTPSLPATIVSPSRI